MKLEINRKVYSIETDPSRPLLEVLRDELDLTGTKYGCGEGACGACTVMVEGRAVRSCTTPVGTVAGKKITTIEGLQQQGRLHPVQEAFLEADALQCGYCTPGMVVAAAALLGRKPNPTRQEIARAMEGNVCRCGVYRRILDAIEAASRRGGKRSAHESGAPMKAERSGAPR